MSLILVIEDDPAILEGLADNLAAEGYEVQSAADGETGHKFARERKPDLIVLDLMLPRMSGYDVCRKLRAEGDAVPILILSARGEAADRVLGLDLGADDYLTKPFAVMEFLARVRALLRRSRSSAALPDILRFDDVVVDFRRFEARRKGRAVDLTRKEFGVLQLLAAYPGQVVSREKLLNDVWGYEKYPTTRTVDNHIAALRAKLEARPSEPSRLLTVHGVGYKLVL